MGVHNKRFIDVCGTCYGVLDRLGNTGAGELSTVLTTKNSDELILISWHGGVRPNASAWADRRAAGPKSPGPEGRRNEQREPLHIKPDGEPCPYKPEQPYNSEGSRCCRRRVLEWPCATSFFSFGSPVFTHLSYSLEEPYMSWDSSLSMSLRTMECLLILRASLLIVRCLVVNSGEGEGGREVYA
jgi:hypothetical protein